MGLLEAVGGAVVGAASVLLFGKVQIDPPALLALGWSPPGLNTTALEALAAARLAGELSAEDFSAQKAVLLGVWSQDRPGGNASVETSAGTDGAAYTWEELSKHASAGDCWVAVHDEVYDLSCFFAGEPCYTHPGNEIVLPLCGGDATEAFDGAGHRKGIADRKGIGHVVLGSLPPSPSAGSCSPPFRKRHATNAHRILQEGWCVCAPFSEQLR